MFTQTSSTSPWAMQFFDDNQPIESTSVIMKCKQHPVIIHVRFFNFSFTLSIEAAPGLAFCLAFAPSWRRTSAEKMLPKTKCSLLLLTFCFSLTKKLLLHFVFVHLLCLLKPPICQRKWTQVRFYWRFPHVKGEFFFLSTVAACMLAFRDCCKVNSTSHGR